MLKIEHTQRMNRRYLLVDAGEQKVKEAILEYVGILGWARASPVFVKESGRDVVTINREEINDIRAALTFGKINVLKVSGTLKGLKLRKT